jgi:hypothetical protein
MYVTEVLFPSVLIACVRPITCCSIKNFQLSIISADLGYKFFGGGIIFINVQ